MKKLIVLDIPYADSNWHLTAGDHNTVFSDIMDWKTERRATDDYELLGVYSKAGVPFEIVKADKDNHGELENWQSVPLDVAEKVRDNVKAGNGILIPSGFCNYAPAVVGGIQQALGKDKKVGVVWIDAHCDNEVAEENEDGDVRFVALPMSTISGISMHDWGREFCLMTEPVRGDYVLLGDGRRSGDYEYNNLKKANIRRITEEEFEDSALWKQKVQELASKVDAIYLMVDADIMTAECIPAYFRYEPGGHDVTKVMENVRTVMDTGLVAAYSVWCIDFDKFDRKNRIADVTYLNGARVIAAGLENWK